MFCPLKQQYLCLKNLFSYHQKNNVMLLHFTLAHLHEHVQQDKQVELTEYTNVPHSLEVCSPPGTDSYFFSASLVKRLISSQAAWKLQKHNAQNRIGYKGDGLKIRGKSLAVTEAATITGSLRCLMPNGPSRVRLSGQLPTETQWTLCQFTVILPFVRQPSTNTPFVHWPLNNSARAKCYDTFLIKVSLSRGGGIF